MYKLSTDIELIIECSKKTINNQKIKDLLLSINQWESFLDLTYAHGVFPSVYLTLKKFSNDIPKIYLDNMRNINIEIAKKNMFMTSELLKIVKLLQSNNIEAISFKGPLLSQIAYGDIVLRQYADLDILIDKKHISKAIDILTTFNYIIDTNEYEAIFNHQEIFHDISLYKNNINFELHWRLFSNEFTTNFEKLNLQNHLQEISVFNTTLKSFDLELLLLYLAIHGAKHNWERLEWLLDISNIIQNNHINWKKLITFMKLTQTTKILLTTLTLCQNILDVELPAEIKKLLKNSEVIELSTELEKYFYDNFKSLIEQKVETKKISYIQYKLLDRYKHKLLFLLSLLKPTELDFKTVQLPKYLNFLYYVIRPFNLMQRWIKKI